MRAFNRPSHSRTWASLFSIALSLNLLACGDPEETDDNNEDSSSTTDSKQTSEGSEADSEGSTKGDSGSKSDDTGSTSDSETPSATSSTDSTGETTETPVKPSLELGYRSIDVDSVLVTWKTPSSYSPDKVRYLVSTADKISEELTYAESILLATESGAALEVSVALYTPGEGTGLSENISIPADHGKDLPDFSMVARPSIRPNTVGIQSMTLNLDLDNRSLYQQNAEEASSTTFHLYVDGQESTKAYSGQDTLAPGMHTLTGFHPGRNYNLQIQSSASPASEQVSSPVSSLVLDTLPKEEFVIAASTQTISINEFTGARLPDFIRANQMEVTIYVDGKKLAAECNVEIQPVYAVLEKATLPKSPAPLYMGIKDSCFDQTSGVGHSVMFEASLKIEATGDTFVTKSSNTNIVHELD